VVAGSKNLESSILKQVQHDAMWCFLNNIRQSFQTRILNLVFNLLRGFYGERRTDDGQRGFSSAFSGFSVFKHTAAAPENGEPTTDNYFFCLQLTTWNLELILSGGRRTADKQRLPTRFLSNQNYRHESERESIRYYCEL